MPDGTSKDIVYERVLDFARREIEEASAEMDELRQALRRLEERVEAAKSVYEAVAARLNLEDELAEEAHRDGMPDMPLSEEPAALSEEPEPQAEPAANNEAQDELASIQQSLEARDKTAPLPIDRASASDENAGSTDDDSALSEAERTLIGEHLRSKRKG